MRVVHHPMTAHRKSTGALRVRCRCDCATSATSPEVVATGDTESSTLEHVWQSFATSCDSTPEGCRPPTAIPRPDCAASSVRMCPGPARGPVRTAGTHGTAAAGLGGAASPNHARSARVPKPEVTFKEGPPGPFREANPGRPLEPQVRPRCGLGHQKGPRGVQSEP